MSNRMTVRRDGKKIYDIVMEESYSSLGKEVAGLSVANRKICIVSDSHVAPLYGEDVKNQLASVCSQVDLFVFPAGEAHKNLHTVSQLYEFLIQKHYDRGDMLAALGGGVAGDLCGFAAATYLRGIRFIQIPTTLLSQVDSSIGGKTGVDFNAYKNMVGAFHMPSLVYTSVSSLLTLSGEQFACGMGEIIKHGLIRDAGYYQWLLDNAKAIQARDLTVCSEMIQISNRIKGEVVEADPTEQGERALLNFGHTLGHAIEKLMDFKLLHGQCVALGCSAAAYISAKRGRISMAEAESVRTSFQQFGLPVSIKGMGLSIPDILSTTKSDKKMDSGVIRFILLNQIGDAYVDRTVTEEEMEDSLTWLLGGQHEQE